MLPTESAAASSSRWLPLLCIMAVLASACSFQPTTQQHSHNQRGLQINASRNVNTNDEVSRLKQSAERLRAEALEAQEKLAGRRATNTIVVTPVKEVEYDAIPDSCWEISYRFADEPISKSKGKEDTQPKQRTFYTGKMQVQFRPDGYTDLIGNLNDDTPDNTQVQFQKVWGWDIETSNEDKLDYLLFSADVQLPRLPSGILPMPERFYFQARVDKNAKDNIVLQDGSVTVKRNVESGTGGWWGLFRGADGILAEFREVGLFRCKAVARDGKQ
ncbi:hypothetical protein ACHAWO_007401 [Cyclotella atomus]|uniref:Lipoprotein n=1 Tax=Cyclotella atomus TaxID=382360 RepID=A0ABD3PM91_9STRA